MSEHQPEPQRTAMPKVSVTIPVYNVEKYLRECLDSVCAQTFTDWECICVDDGSTDSSPSILDEYAAKDKRFTIIKREHSNAGACRNAGLDIAKGEYLSFLDADDVFASRMLENMLRIAEEYGPDIVVCSKMDFSLAEQLNAFYLKAKERHSVEILHKPAETINIFERWMGWAWDKLFKRVQVIKYGFKFQECPANNDLSFVFSMLSVARSIVEVREVFVAHRKHLQSIEGSVGYKNPWCVCNALSHYYGQMFRLGVFEGNDFLLRNFLNYTICFSIGRLCVSKAYDEIQPEMNVIRAMIEARTSQNLTQKQLAEKTGIAQTEISRLENGTRNPSIKLLQRLAEGMGMVLDVQFRPKGSSQAAATSKG